jgi:hypothetical protein
MSARLTNMLNDLINENRKKMDDALVHQRSLLMQNVNRRVEEEINEFMACVTIGDWVGATSHQLFANSILDALKKLEATR